MIYVIDQEQYELLKKALQVSTPMAVVAYINATFGLRGKVTFLRVQ